MSETCYSVIVTMWTLTHVHGLRAYIFTGERYAIRTILPSLNQTEVNTTLTMMMKTVAQSVRQVTITTSAAATTVVTIKRTVF